MALQRGDPGGLDISSSTTILLNAGFNNDNSLVGVTNAAPAGRSNTHAYTTSVSSSFLGWWFTTGWQDTIFGFAYYNGNTTFTANARVCNCQDGATTQVDLRTDATGHLFFTRNGTAIGGSSANALGVGWYYIEMRVHVATGTNGVAELRVTPLGQPASIWLTTTGVSTQATANASANRFYVISRGSLTQYWKDIYILDMGTGVDKNYLGDVTIKTLYPVNGDPTFQQWSPNTGSQTSCVQDGITQTGSWPDGDTTFISDTVAGDISAFQMQNITPTGVIVGVIHVSYARTASTGTINQVTVQSSLVVETSPTITLTTSYLYYIDIMELNPAGKVTWTAIAVDISHIGVKIQATSASARTSQELLLVVISNTVTEISSQPHVWIST